MDDRKYNFATLGPPNPIDYLRSINDSSVDLKRYDAYDSDEEGIESAAPRKQQQDAVAAEKPQDPPARERPDGDVWPYRETLSFTRTLVFYGAGSITQESERACRHIQRARKFRHTYYGGMGTKIVEPELLLKGDLDFRMGKDGVMELYHASMEEKNLIQVPSIDSFAHDYAKLVEYVNEGAMRSYCFQRLQLLSTSFKMHNTINATVERVEQSNLLGTDFYRTMKIDNHIHAAAAPTAKQFVEFVRRKLENEGDTQVSGDGKTLSQVFADAGLDIGHLCVLLLAQLFACLLAQKYYSLTRSSFPFSPFFQYD